ncbi:hypothetical protein DL93DRAFT_2074287 [Clavulina sp. PMI_390]|nr:hypothetical protein DL93DRAFT_2074287 [Clavulina sp. PMI_390]
MRDGQLDINETIDLHCRKMLAWKPNLRMRVIGAPKTLGSRLGIFRRLQMEFPDRFLLIDKGLEVDRDVTTLNELRQVDGWFDWQ